MTHLVRIGNSHGVRIPKPFIEQAQLDGKELTLQIVSGGLLIAPKSTPRNGWKEQIEQSLSSNEPESSDNDWLDLPLDSDSELEW